MQICDFEAFLQHISIPVTVSIFTAEDKLDGRVKLFQSCKAMIVSFRIPKIVKTTSNLCPIDKPFWHNPPLKIVQLA